MIVIIRADATEEQVHAIVARAVSLGVAHHLSRGAERAVLLTSGGDASLLEQEFSSLPGVDEVLPLVLRVSHLPIVVGPAPGSRQRSMIEPLVLAGIAAGAHGIVIEAQRTGASPSADGKSVLDSEQLGRLTAQMHTLKAALGVGSPLPS